MAEAFFQATAWTMDTPKPYGAFHLVLTHVPWTFHSHGSCPNMKCLLPFYPGFRSSWRDHGTG